MNYKLYFIISVVVFSFSISTFFIGNHIYNQQSEIEFYKNKMVILESFIKNPCPEGYWYFIDYVEGCVPEDIINPANTNAVTYLENFHEWEQKQVMGLGCGTGLSESQCYFEGMEIYEKPITEITIIDRSNFGDSGLEWKK